MPNLPIRLFMPLARNLRDVAIICAVLAVFQFAVLQQPLPALAEKLAGAGLIVAGLTLFLAGLSMSIFPLGERLTEQIVGRGRLWLLLLFAFGIGFGSTVAEPALIAVTEQAAAALVADRADDEAGMEGMAAEGAGGTALLLRLATALAVGLSVAASCIRIARGRPAYLPVVAIYAVVLLLSVLFPSRLAGIAFDAGAAATSAINVPLIAALGIGLATAIEGRSPLADGFGAVALASAMPLLVILAALLLLG